MVQSISSETAASESEATKAVDKLAGIGGLVGAAAAVIGLASLALAGMVPAGTVLEIPSLGLELTQNHTNIVISAVFVAILALGLFLQYRGARVIGSLTESRVSMLTLITGIVALGTTSIILGGLGVPAIESTPVNTYRSSVALGGAVFIIMWQFVSITYVDSSKSYRGMAAGMMNGFFFPALAINAAAGYALLLGGQLAMMVFWWGPRSQIREFARSTDTAKFAFGLSGFLTFLIGGFAAFGSALQSVEGVGVWLPWSSATVVGSKVVYTTPPWFVQALLSSMLFWSLLGPRLGARELRESQISEDIVKGASKYLMIFMAILGIIAAGQCGTGVATPRDSDFLVPAWSMFQSLCPAAIMFLMGSSYMRSTDVVTGLPLVLASVYALIGPYVLSSVAIFTWALLILTQGILTIETKFRKFTHFSQKFLTVIVTVVPSVLFVLFMLGAFGSGPPALWPANRWFNVALLAGIPPDVQGPTIIATVLSCLLVRNVALSGYAFGRGYSRTGVIGGVSFLFALMIITISGNAGVVHQALTAAALSFGLYAVSYVLVLSLNLNLGADILKAGHQLEGQFVRVAATAGLAAGILVAVFLFLVFSGAPLASDISIAITLLVMLIAGIEITCVITWISAGIRLKMLTEGLRLKMP
ncbi:MAG: hypothetical protein C4K47_04470 [Candidatus Thorarchaeota archaeon]|nr:MAG: hypothetical protein C4K47_04470 [Candidatus Thorarchaeota archaeon]